MLHRHCCIMIFLALVSSVVSSAQIRDSSFVRNVMQARPEMADTVSVKDTLILTPIDSAEFAALDSTGVGASDSSYVEAGRSSGGTLDKPAFSTARDSVIEDPEKNIIYYFGEVTAKYQDMELTADYMSYNTELNVVYARGTLDTITNELVGRPVMKQGNQQYEMDEVFYNFNSRKAKIKNMDTQQDQGKIKGHNLKMMPDQSINIEGGQYTVCDAEHPHYYLKMTTAKVITKPKQKTIFGPAYPVIADVPLPLVLPFGFVPDMPDRASGILIPTYGEEAARGMYLRDLGYSFVIGDFMDLALTADFYTYGSWAGRVTSRYKKRYKFDGNVSINYSSDVTGEKGSKDYNQSKNFGVTWSHSQDSKARPGTSFRASVNFSSPSNNKYNSASVTESLQNQMSSSISYSKTWSGMSLSVNALHNQNSRDSSYTVTLPNITFTVNRFYPFKRKNKVGKSKIYEDISLSYNTTLQNKVSFKASDFSLDKNLLNKMQNGMTHNFAIGLPAFTLLKYLNFSPSLSYGMNWFFRTQYMEYNPETDKVETKQTDQFSNFGITQTYSGGLSMSTRIYGTFNFHRKGGRVQAIRHMISPSISFSGRPELGTAANGYTTYTYTDAKGESKTVEYNKYSGGIYSPPSKGKSASLSFSIGNNLEAKVRKKLDPDSEEAKDPKKSTEKVKLIDQLNIGGSYNFLADSLKLSNISVSASTTVFGKLGINGNLTLDPYAVNERGQRINTFNVVKTGRLARLTNASASLSWSISGGGKYKGNDGQKNEDTYTKVYYHPLTGEYIPGGWTYYTNPNIPWSLSLNYSYSYQKSYQYANEQLQVKNSHTQTLGISGQIRFIKALSANINTGFDITAMKLSTTQISATYDLHCFAISMSWVPNGQWESWSFRIAAKASGLSDLLQFKKSASFWDK